MKIRRKKKCPETITVNFVLQFNIKLEFYLFCRMKKLIASVTFEGLFFDNEHIYTANCEWKWVTKKSK